MDPPEAGLDIYMVIRPTVYAKMAGTFVKGKDLMTWKLCQT
jgi:hypothetical protein